MLSLRNMIDQIHQNVYRPRFALVGVKNFPAMENTLSQGADVAIMPRSSRARARRGHFKGCPRQYTSLAAKTPAL